MTTKREDMENQLKKKFEFEKQDLENLKAELKQEREDLDRVNEMMNKEKMDLELMRSDIQKQTHMLEEDKQVIKEERDKFYVTKADLEKQKEHTDSLLSELNLEKTNIEELTLQIKRERDELGDVMNMITLKQKEQELKEEELERLKQELETSKSNVLTEREELEELRKDLNKKKKELEAAINNISLEREELIKMKTDNEKEREMLLDEKDRMEDERSERKTKEDQLMNQMKSMETLRVKLQQLNEQMSEDMKNKMASLQQNIVVVQKLCTESEQKLTELDEQKENIAGCREVLEREREGLKCILSDMATKREDMENQLKKKFELEKQDLENLKADLKQEREDLERLKVMMNKEKTENLGQDLTEEKLEITISDKQEQPDRTVDETNQEKEQLYQTETSTEKTSVEREMYELKTRVDQLISVINSMGHLRVKLKQLSQRAHGDFRENMDILEQKKGDILQMRSIMELKCDDLVEQARRITGLYHLIQEEKKVMETLKFDKEAQTEGVEFEGDRYIRQTHVSTQTLEHQWKLEEDKYPTRDDVTDGKTSRRDYLRNMWKDTQTERKEIDQMKRRGHEVRNNMEKRLQVINQFVRRTLLQKEPKEPSEKMNLEQGLSKDTTCHTDCKIDHNALDEKYAELEQLKVRMLSEIDKLRVREKVSARTTSDKGNQTFQVDVTTGGATEQASSTMHREADEAPETSSGLLCQLRHYCYRCCCPCCSCCQQACPEEA